MGRRRTLVCAAVAVAALFSAAGSAQAVTHGVVPNTFRYSLHQPVPLFEMPNPFELPAEFERIVMPRELIGAPATTAAGAHPDLTLGMVTKVDGTEDEVLAGLATTTGAIFELSPGVTMNLGRVPACTAASFETLVVGPGKGGCPAETQVGVVGALFGGQLQDRTYPLYKLETPAGHFAALGFAYKILFLRLPMIITADLRPDFGLTLSRFTQPEFDQFLPAPFMTIWGVPGDASHNKERLNPATAKWGMALVPPHAPLVDNSSACGAGALEARLRLQYAGEETLPDDPEDLPYRAFAPGPTGCAAAEFDPGAKLSPSSEHSDSSTGLGLSLRLGHDQTSTAPAVPPLREAVLTLPSGVSLNPAAANGLSGCDRGQIGLGGPGLAACPAASKLGTAVVETGLSEAPLSGAVYLAEPFENPFGSRWALYVVVGGPGFTLKLPGRVDIVSSGQVRVTMDSLPQLPVDAVDLELTAGPGAVLSTPQTCGSGAARLGLTPWSAPESGPPESIEQVLHFESGPDGRPCSLRGPEPFAPGFAAAVGSPLAGASSALGLRVSRVAGEQTLRSFAVTLPRGLSASIRGRSLCSADEIAKIEERAVPGGGALERSQPACPPGSRLGSVNVAAGTGVTPLSLDGSIYLAGPYKGAPFSLVAVVPAVAGGVAGAPLADLGAVLVRSALRVDPRTAQLRAESDRLPRDLDGIPLRIQEVTLRFDQPGLIRNPSNCEQDGVGASVAGEEGGQAELVSGFQVSGCGRMAFQPRLSLRSTGGNGRGQHPRLAAVLRTGPEDSRIAGARVVLPPQLGFDRSRLGDVCRPTRLALRACPPDSQVGRAVAWSPLLDEPLQGAVHLTPAAGGLPGLVLSFGGRLPVQLTAALSRSGGRLRVDLAELPDVPLSKLAISLGEQGKSFLVARRGICPRPSSAASRFVAYNGKVARRTPVLRAGCQREE